MKPWVVFHLTLCLLYVVSHAHNDEATRLVHPQYEQRQQAEGASGDVDKREFVPWGGKRTDRALSLAELNAITNQLEKQLAKKATHQITAPGDTRSLGAGGDFGEIAASKRSANGVSTSDVDRRSNWAWGEKRVFQPWGGKRSLAEDLSEKRAFQPWGGKRASFQPWGGKRASFQPWGGKRASFQPWGGKRASFQPWGGKRAAFQPWGGK